jgi:hypothetical protein
VHETCEFWGVFDECSRTIEKIFAKVYIYILICLQETNTAVYINVVENLPERTEIDLKGLGVHEICEFWGFLTNVLDLLRKFMRKYIYFDRSWRDKHGSIYICSLKQNRTFGNWTKTAWGAQNMWFWSFSDECSRTIEKVHAKVHIF